MLHQQLDSPADSATVDQCSFEQCLTEWNCLECEINDEVQFEICAIQQGRRVCWDCGKSDLHPPRRGACTPCKMCNFSFCPGNPIRGGTCVVNTRATMPAQVLNAVGKPITPRMRELLLDAQKKWATAARQRADAFLAQSLDCVPPSQTTVERYQMLAEYACSDTREQMLTELSAEMTATLVVGGPLVHGPLHAEHRVAVDRCG
jgi:hypothetical protein